MKVELTPTITNQKVNFLTKVRRFFLKKTKPLPNDTFEKKSEMKDFCNRKIISRSHPNWCDAPEDGYSNSTIARTRCYYPEDCKKMKSMTENEAVKYSIELDKAGRYYYDDNHHVDTPKLDDFFKKHNINLNKYVIKEDK